MLRDCLGNRALSKSVIPTNSYGLLMGQDTTIAFKNCHFQGLQGKKPFLNISTLENHQELMDDKVSKK